MLSINDRAELVNLAMQAEAEHYNQYFMRGASETLKEFADIHGIKILWGFLINETPITYRLYLEFCLQGSNAFLASPSFKVV